MGIKMHYVKNVLVVTLNLRKHLHVYHVKGTKQLQC